MYQLLRTYPRHLNRLQTRRVTRRCGAARLPLDKRQRDATDEQRPASK